MKYGGAKAIRGWFLRKSADIRTGRLNPVWNFLITLRESETRSSRKPLGWQSNNRAYAFVYVPDVPGEIGLMPDKTALDQKFSGTGAIVFAKRLF